MEFVGMSPKVNDPFAAELPNEMEIRSQCPHDVGLLLVLLCVDHVAVGTIGVLVSLQVLPVDLRSFQTASTTFSRPTACYSLT